MKIQDGTVVADDGSLLRMVHTYVHDFAVPYFSDVDWWKEQHDVGHFNTVRVMAFLGAWSSQAGAQQMDVPTLLARLDVMVQNAAATGMYVLIDNHSECCGNQDVTNDTALWNAVAPRYAASTNVLYELKNEPWQYSGLPAYETTMYNVIRPLAPDTHIICWTIENMIDLKDPVSLFVQSPVIDYANASVGFHPYGTYGNTTQLAANVAAARAKYPVVLTELGPGAAGAPAGDAYLTTMETEGTSWSFLSFGFFDLDDMKAYGDPSFLTAANGVHVLWPED